jgi:hypothetical protein
MKLTTIRPNKGGRATNLQVVGSIPDGVIGIFQ